MSAQFGFQPADINYFPIHDSQPIDIAKSLVTTTFCSSQKKMMFQVVQLLLVWTVKSPFSGGLGYEFEGIDSRPRFNSTGRHHEPATEGADDR
jgi:hypothetical protein